jgi:hypothetical protein
MLTRGEDYAHQQPSLTKKKLRRLEITAGAPKYAKTARGIWSSNHAIRQAKRKLAAQAEGLLEAPGHRPTSRRPGEKGGRGRDTGARMKWALKGQSRAADSKLLCLRFATSVTRAHQQANPRRPPRQAGRDATRRNSGGTCTHQAGRVNASVEARLRRPAAPERWKPEEFVRQALTFIGRANRKRASEPRFHAARRAGASVPFRGCVSVIE